MPYLYSSFYETTQTGIPIARSLAIDYTFDDTIYDCKYQNQYLFGHGILVAPVESDKNLLKVYLPEGKWYDLLTDQQFDGNSEIIAECGIEKIPAYVKGSSIIPICPDANTNTKNLGYKLELHIYNGNENNSFLYYEDDGESFGYQAGSFYKRLIEFNPKDKTIRIGQAAGAYQTKIKNLAICLHGFANDNFKLNGNSADVTTKEYRFIKPISNFDPFGNETGAGLKIDNLKIINTDNEGSEILVSW